jgi:signal transduction histidine kinase
MGRPILLRRAAVRLSPVDSRAVTARAGWLTALSLVVVLAVNVAGLVGIALARRAAGDDARRAFEAETGRRARAIEKVLAGARADLAFVADSAPIGHLAEASAGSQREGAESALLLFLRGHPEVEQVIVRSPTRVPVFHAGRRGGVPLLWASSNPTGQEGSATAPGLPHVATVVPAKELTVEIEVAPLVLLQQGEPAGEPARSCALLDALGQGLAQAGTIERAGQALTSDAEVRSDAWSPPPPWTLRCSRTGTAALVEPVAARYRTTLALNLAVMVLALLLGAFTVQQSRRRERLEAASREEAHVRELERQLFHAERLATVGRLAAGIAHEINNPLEGMANYLALARDALGRGERDEAERHLGRVKEGLDRAAAVVRQVLAHADPAKAPLQLLDFNEVLRETSQFVESRQDFRGVAFALELTGGPLLVRGSHVMLGQVAVNLVLNACEAQPRGGEVRIRSRNENGYAVAEFADRGPGVAEADRARIFEPFYSTKDTTGLGLSICHSIVRQHGGELTVLAREGGGAVFRLRLPAVES